MNKKFLFSLLVLALPAVPLLALFHSGLPITHDGQDHVARIANFYQNLTEGIIIPRWAANLNWGFGHPILMFLYPLPSYIASFFHFLGFSLVDSTKIVFGLTYLLSGFSMYLWIREFTNRNIGYIAALLYLFAPYRFVDLYVRGAIGEHVAFVFPPLIFYFLLKLSRKYYYKYTVGLAISIAGLILSHNAISLMFLPLIFSYTLYLLWAVKNKKTVAVQFLFGILLGFGVSAFFWIPAFFEGRYTLRDIVTSGEIASLTGPFKNLLYGLWNYGGTGQFTTQVGIVQWGLLVASFFGFIPLYRKKKRISILHGIFFITFILSLFLMTSASNAIWQTITILQKFQFPWRFLSVAVFATTVLGSLAIFVMPKKFQFILCCLVVLALVFFNKDYWYAQGYLIKNESFFTGIYKGTTDTGESSPIWSVRFMEHEPNAHMEVIDGNASIKEIKRTSTIHAYSIEAKERSRFRENTLYFPGWEVLIDNKKSPIEFQDQANRGLITFFVGKGLHTVELRFVETKLRFFADIVALISIGTLLLFKRFTFQ